MKMSNIRIEVAWKKIENVSFFSRQKKKRKQINK